MRDRRLHKGGTQASKFPPPPKLRIYQDRFGEYLGAVIDWAGYVLETANRPSKPLGADEHPEIPGQHWEIPGEEWLAGDAMRAARELLSALNIRRFRPWAHNDDLVHMATLLERTLSAWRSAASAANRKGARAESASTECIRLALNSGRTDKDGVIDWCRNYYGDDYDIEVDEAGEFIKCWPEDGRPPSIIRWESIPRIMKRISDRK